MTNCLLSFLAPFLIGLGLEDSHLVILFLCSLTLSFFLISASFMFLLLSFFVLFDMLCATLHLAVFLIYISFLPIKKKWASYHFKTKVAMMPTRHPFSKSTIKFTHLLIRIVYSSSQYQLRQSKR